MSSATDLIPQLGVEANRPCRAPAGVLHENLKPARRFEDFETNADLIGLAEPVPPGGAAIMDFVDRLLFAAAAVVLFYLWKRSEESSKRLEEMASELRKLRSELQDRTPTARY